MRERCAECGLEIRDSRELALHMDTEQPHHWSCLQEAYEREELALADEADDTPQ